MTDRSKKVNLAKRGNVLKLKTNNSSLEPLTFYTSHKKPCFVDLREFANGVSIEISSGGANTSRISSVFSGRPELISELFPVIKDLYRSHAPGSVKTLKSSLRWWWQFFDAYDRLALAGERFTSSSQWNGIHHAHYRIEHLTGRRICTAATAQIFFRILRLARVQSGLPFWWPAIETPPAERQLISGEEIKEIYHFFRRAVRQGRQRMEDANEKNPLYFQNEFSDIALQTAPSGMEEMKGVRTLDDPAPFKDEIAALFVLFVIQSGWNPQVVLDIDISCRNENGDLECIKESLSKPGTHSQVISFKERAKGSVQRTESQNSSTFSPANIVLYLAKQTEPLREVLREELRLLENEYSIAVKLRSSESAIREKEIEIAVVEQKIRSPWLYRSRSHRYWGKIEALAPSATLGYDGKSVGLIAWAILSINKDVEYLKKADEGEGQINRKTKIREDINLTDFRDAFLVWRYESNGYSWLEALIASGSSDLRALRSYLNKKRLKRHAAEELIRGTDAIWTTIMVTPQGELTSRLFPILVAARVEGVTNEQIDRWLDGKDRTLAGTGCRNVMAPPRYVDPAHRDGKPCSTQRCFICKENSILITDERGANDLARARAELEFTKIKLSLRAWSESTWPLELENIEACWAEFDQSYIDLRYQWWREQIANGLHIPIQLEGYYDNA
ncbi:hypothetical protein [uncultured Herbaspirillum sp.]|uniref:hypothetical protein n=1 Tax=uncultured Herbaspirillum sp. TaxID=160236 RepID=UPI0025902E26|nr:hypothetical protein [uncultured Herbaspirillum sp.]